MPFNLNKPSGIAMLFILGGSTASFPPYFIFEANYDPISANVFLIVGAVLLAIGALLLLANKNASENDKNAVNTSVPVFLLLLNIITAVVMFILGQTIRFW